MHPPVREAIALAIKGISGKAGKGAVAVTPAKRNMAIDPTPTKKKSKMDIDPTPMKKKSKMDIVPTPIKNKKVSADEDALLEGAKNMPPIPAKKKELKACSLLSGGVGRLAV